MNFNNSELLLLNNFSGSGSIWNLTNTTQDEENRDSSLFVKILAYTFAGLICSCICSIVLCLMMEFCKQIIDERQYRRRYRARVQNYHQNIFNRMYPSPIVEIDLEKGIRYHQKVLVKISELDNISLDPENKCTICFESIMKDEKVCILDCGHMFHQDCISSWVNTKLKEKRKITCPVCRDELNHKQLEEV